MAAKRIPVAGAAAFKAAMAKAEAGDILVLSGEFKAQLEVSEDVTISGEGAVLRPPSADGVALSIEEGCSVRLEKLVLEAPPHKGTLVKAAEGVDLAISDCEFRGSSTGLRADEPKALKLTRTRFETHPCVASYVNNRGNVVSGCEDDGYLAVFVSEAEKVEFDACTFSEGAQQVQLEQVGFVDVQGSSFSATTSWDSLTANGCAQVRVAGSTFTGVGIAISISGSSEVLVEGNQFDGIKRRGIDISSGSRWEDGDEIDVESEVVIASNVIEMAEDGEQGIVLTGEIDAEVRDTEIAGGWNSLLARGNVGIEGDGNQFYGSSDEAVWVTDED